MRLLLPSETHARLSIFFHGTPCVPCPCCALTARAAGPLSLPDQRVTRAAQSALKQSTMRPTMMPRRGTVSTPSPASTSKSGAAPPALARATSTGQVPVSKHRAAFQAILRGAGSAGTTEEADRTRDPERFYFDLFCLGVDRSFLAGLVDAVPTSALIESGSIKV